VSQREALFHDNRAASLDEAFVKHRHQLSPEVSAQEIADLVEFLRRL
jgi:hypothetical protein